MSKAHVKSGTASPGEFEGKTGLVVIMSEHAAPMLEAWALYHWLPMSTLLLVHVGLTHFPLFSALPTTPMSAGLSLAHQGLAPVSSLLRPTPVLAPPAAIPLAKAPL